MVYVKNALRGSMGEVFNMGAEGVTRGRAVFVLSGRLLSTQEREASTNATVFLDGFEIQIARSQTICLGAYRALQTRIVVPETRHVSRARRALSPSEGLCSSQTARSHAPRDRRKSMASAALAPATLTAPQKHKPAFHVRSTRSLTLSSRAASAQPDFGGLPIRASRAGKELSRIRQDPAPATRVQIRKSRSQIIRAANVIAPLTIFP